MHWLALMVSGLLEALFPFLLILTEGFTRWQPLLILIITGCFTLQLLKYSLDAIPISVAYLAWTALGAFGTVMVGVVMLNESVSLWRFLFLATLVMGVVGLQLATDRQLRQVSRG